MYAIAIDREARDLLYAAADMAHAALRARAARLDENDVIGRSVRMSEIKVRDALRQLDMPPLIEWSGFADDQRAAVTAICAEIMSDASPVEKAHAFAALRSYVLLRGTDETPLQSEAESRNAPQK